MYREFSFTSISTSARNKSITVYMTAEVDETSVSGSNIQLLDCETNHFVLIDYKLTKDKIIITLPFYPIPNSRYKLCIKGITDIVGNPLKRGINYDIQFASSVKTNADFLSPSFAEKVSELVFSFEEYIDSDDYQHIDDIEMLNSYFVEVATDNLFNNIVFSSELIDRNTMTVMDLKNGQYYSRVRVQKGEDYGIWSKVITFVLDKPEYDEYEDDSNTELNNKNDDMSPTFYRPLTIVGVPKDGDDINSFFIELSDAIDTDCLENIEVYRRLV